MTARRVRRGDGTVCILAVGKMLEAAEEAAGKLAADGVDATVWDVRVVSPPDPAMLADAATHGLVVTVEDGIRVGGAGSFLVDAMSDLPDLDHPLPPVRTLGVPRTYIAQGKPDGILADAGARRAGDRHRRRRGPRDRAPAPAAPLTVGPAGVPGPAVPPTGTCSSLFAVEFNLADLFEAAVDAFADREYIVADGRRITYGHLEERANRLAHHLAAAGVGPGDHVGIYALNSAEWVETAWAVFKLRAVWININYRYVEDELRYLFSNADLVALVHQRQFAPRVASLLPELPALRHVVVIDDDSQEPDPCHDAVGFEDAVAAGSPERDFAPRSGDDRYILYTGGTTGMPKGVVWPQRNVFYALGGGIDALTGVRVERPEQMVEKGLASGGQLTFLPIAPLMHGATQWAVMGQSFVGNRIVLVPKFDPHEVWTIVGREKVNMIMITGDAMGKPLVESLDEPDVAYDLSSLIGITSTAALFSPAVKDAFFAQFPNLIMTDAIGSSEGGNNGISMVQRGATAMKSGPTVSSTGGTVVFDENFELVKPGSGVIGKIARSGDIPVGYYNDPAKTRRGVHQRRRHAVRHAGRLRHRRGRRFRHVAGAGVDLHQLRRGEDLPRGGRGRGALAPRDHGRHRRGRPRRALRPTGGGHHRAPARSSRAVARGRAGALPQARGRVQGAAPAPCRRQDRTLAERQARLPVGQHDRDDTAPGRLVPATVPADLASLVGDGRCAVLTMELQRGVVGDLSSFPELAEAVRRDGVIANTARLLDAARCRRRPGRALHGGLPPRPAGVTA